MIIEINKDIDRYQESVVLGLTVKQLFYAVLSLTVGAGVVLLLQKQIGLTMAAYIAVPVVAPLALQGFYQYNGMSFMEVMKRKIFFAFCNRPLLYVSEEASPIKNTPTRREKTRSRQKLSERENCKGKRDERRASDEDISR